MTDKDKFEHFDIEDPDLPKQIRSNAMLSGDYPYDEKLKRKIYETDLLRLQGELVKLQRHLQATDERLTLVFEGRDAAGKGGTIKTYLEYLNPRVNRIAALPKPSDRERGEWYFQRFVRYLPSAGETVLFDRSWYNRAGVEPVMGFCTPQQAADFLIEAPRFERMIIDDGMHFFKFWLDIGREMQIKRFHDRRHDPLKVWKLSPVDMKALEKWDDYSIARDDMLKTTDSSYAPWIVVRANDKRRARLNVIRTVLNGFDYEGRDSSVIGSIDEKIVLTAEDFLLL